MSWICMSRVGPFRIQLMRGRYHIICNDKDLGTYDTPDEALDELIGGYTDWPSPGTNPATLDLPDDLSEWERLV